LFKAKPVNRDTLNAVDYKQVKGKPKAALAVALIHPKPLEGKPKVSVVKASMERSRKAKTRRTFGFKGQLDGTYQFIQAEPTSGSLTSARSGYYRLRYQSSVVLLYSGVRLINDQMDLSNMRRTGSKRLGHLYAMWT
jgi:hypothetical protein